MREFIFDDRILVTYTYPYTCIISAIFVVLLEGVVGIRAPYGRYNKNNSGIPARLAWFIQELPCFLIPCYLLYYYWSFLTLTKFLVIAFYLVHYFQR